MQHQTIISVLLLLSCLSTGWSYYIKDRQTPIIQYGGRDRFPGNTSDWLPPDWKSLPDPFQVNVSRGNALPTKDPEGDKIFGGIALTPNSAPYLVLVEKFTGNVMEPWCGGSVLDSTHILSAAHCFKDMDPDLYMITAGEHDNTVHEGTEQYMYISKITRHPKYLDGSYPNDVAVVTLSSSLNLGSTAKAVDLNSEDTCPQPGDTCTVVGWGKTESGSGSTLPLKVDVPIQADSKCSAVYSQYGQDQLCAGKEGLDSCSGDSGGPLVCQCGGSMKQVGVVSYGAGCAVKGYPGVYAKVSHFLHWIKKTAGL